MRWWLAGGFAAFVASASMAAAAAEVPARTPEEVFRTICVANDARLEAVEAAARAAGFKPASNVPPPSEGFSRIVGLERTIGPVRQVVVVSAGVTEVAKALPGKSPARTCGVTEVAGGWDARGFARRWTGVAPILEQGGVAVYSYLQRPTGNVLFDVDDLPALVVGLNAGQIRALAVTEVGGTRGLAWTVIEAPNPPAVAPARVAAGQPPAPRPEHDADPFAPCVWKADGKAPSQTRSLFCPRADGKLNSFGERVRVRETTPVEARAGDTTAMLRLAAFYFTGPEAVRDPGAGFDWSRRAAEAGAAQGAFNLGLAYEAGAGTPADKAQAAAWYRKASEAGNIDGTVSLAAMLLAGGGAPKDPAAAVALLRRAADAGSTTALFDLGLLNQTGLGTPQDYAEAQRLYRLLADKKDASGMYGLGVIYADGLGVAKSEAEAKRWFVAAVTPLLRVAMAANGFMSTGLGLDQPQRRAVQLEKAAAGDGRAAMDLGLYFSDRTGGAYNPKEAQRLLRIAADQGFPLAMLRLGAIYAEGEGTSQDDAEAVRWLRAGGKRNWGSFRRVTAFYDPPSS